MGHDWRTAIDMNDWMRDQERRTTQVERRPVPGLQTPATFARTAVRVDDWDLPPATINGFFYSDPDGANSPVPGDPWVGSTVVDPAGFGVQVVWRYQGDALTQYARQFTSFTGTPSFEAWQQVFPAPLQPINVSAAGPWPTAVPGATTGTAFVVARAGIMQATFTATGYVTGGTNCTVEVYVDGVLRGQTKLSSALSVNVHMLLAPLVASISLTAGTHYVAFRSTEGASDGGDYASMSGLVIPT